MFIQFEEYKPAGIGYWWWGPYLDLPFLDMHFLYSGSHSRWHPVARDMSLQYWPSIVSQYMVHMVQATSRPKLGQYRYNDDMLRLISKIISYEN